VFIICLKQILLGATKFGGHKNNWGQCTWMTPRGYVHA